MNFSVFSMYLSLAVDPIMGEMNLWCSTYPHLISYLSNRSLLILNNVYKSSVSLTILSTPSRKTSMKTSISKQPWLIIKKKVSIYTCRQLVNNTVNGVNHGHGSDAGESDLHTPYW